MAGQTRSFDTEAAQAFATFLQEQALLVEQDLIEPYFKNDGPLTKLPAFGIGDSADELAEKYRQLHSGVWNDLHVARADLLGLVSALEDVIESYGQADSATAAEFDSLSGGSAAI